MSVDMPVEDRLRACQMHVMDASFSLTVEVFSLLTVGLSTYGWGNLKQKDQIQFPDGGGTVSEKDLTNFHREQKKPNQTEFQP